MNDELSSAASPSASSSIPAPIIPSEDTQDPPPTTEDVTTRKRKNREVFNRKRGEFLDDLLRSFDLLVFTELSVIYYMDCFFFRFFLRAMVQMVFLTPKAGMFPDPPGNRPYIGAIIGVNALCFILHAFGTAPTGGEATRGYLHGGLVMDFIGQKGPSSKIHLLLLDVVVLVLQIAHLSAHLLRQRLKDGSLEAQRVGLVFSRGQSVDEEERGVRHSGEMERREEIEMMELNPAAASARAAPAAMPRGRDGEDEDTEAEASSSARDALLPPDSRTSTPAATTAISAESSSSAIPRSDAHIFDAFNSGQIVIADLNLLRTVQDQLLAYQKGPQSSASASPDTLRAESRRLLRERFVNFQSLHWAR